MENINLEICFPFLLSNWHADEYEDDDEDPKEKRILEKLAAVTGNTDIGILLKKNIPIGVDKKPVLKTYNGQEQTWESVQFR